MLAEVDLGGALAAGEIAPPRASVFLGAGGIACALYRMALQRDDARLLALADLWLTRAEGAAGAADAFLNPEMDLTAAVAGTVSPYHTASGLAAVRALVAHAQGDLHAARQAAARFARLGLEPIAPIAADDGEAEGEPPPGSGNPDLTLGRSGVLLVSALLGDVLPDGAAERALLADLGGRALASLWAELDRLPPLAAHAVPPNLGIAHGWAGYAYATLRWCAAFARPQPAGLAARLAELAAAAEPWGRGLRWPWNGGGGEAATMPGWCNGSAGFVYLWTLAHRRFGDPRFLALATGAAWNAWEGGDGGGGICCGAAGRAYALAHLARHLGGDPGWLARAGALADRAALAVAAGSEKADSLFTGRVGVALLAAELERPESAALPFFADEGWRAGA
jgi:serine/threonine-protein kinase